MADVDGDSHDNILIGNSENHPNHVLMNRGNGTFEVVSNLSGHTNVHTRALAVGDLNDDGYIDIITANEGRSNQILANDEKGTFFFSQDLPGGDKNTSSVIIFGDENGQNYFLINMGNGNFSEVSLLPGNEVGITTNAVALGDFDKNGAIDIILANEGQSNLLYESIAVF